jgi:SEC-C motif-containing protein
VEAPQTRNLGRNDPCHCGSGKKYKQCCLGKDEAAERAARAKAADEAEAAAPPAGEDAAKAVAPVAPRHNTRQPWKGHTNTRGFQKVSTPRKVGGGS